jgi:hypothetical protein
MTMLVSVISSTLASILLLLSSLEPQPLKQIASIDLPRPKGQRFDYLTVDDEDHWLLSAHLAHHGRGLAHFSALVGYHAGRDGRTPTHDPRLLASQQSERHQQVPSGNDKEQAFSTGKARGCHPAWRSAVGKQIKPNPLTPEMTSFPNCGGRKVQICTCGTVIGPKRTQIVYVGSP